MELSPERRLLPVHGVRYLEQYVPGREIEDPVDRVQAQPIEMVLPDPVQCVVHDEPAHLVAPPVVVVDCGSPRGLVLLREIWAKLPEVVPFRSEVLVDDIEQYRQD